MIRTAIKKKWTRFWDMSSGGGIAEPPYEEIYIEAPIEEATLIFWNRFGHDPYNVTCPCCGQDYDVQDYDTIEQATNYHRARRNQTINEYVENKDVLIIYNKDILINDKG